jgi:hypothetical protein
MDTIDLSYGEPVEIKRKSSYVRITCERVTLYVHDDYTDYRWLGPAGEAKAQAHAARRGGRVLEWRTEGKRRNVVRIKRPVTTASLLK